MASRVLKTWSVVVGATTTNYQLLTDATGSFAIEREDADAQGVATWTPMTTLSSAAAEAPWTGVSQLVMVSLLVECVATRVARKFMAPIGGESVECRAVRTGPLAITIERQQLSSLGRNQWALVARLSGDSSSRSLPSAATEPLLAELLQATAR